MEAGRAPRQHDSDGTGPTGESPASCLSPCGSVGLGLPAGHAETPRVSRRASAAGVTECRQRRGRRVLEREPPRHPPTLRGPPSSSRQGLSSAHSWGAPACRTFGGRRKENEALLEGLPSPAIGAGAQPGQLERTGQSPRAPSGGAAGQPGRCSLCWGTGTQPQAPQQGGGTGSQPESRAGPGTPHAWPPAQERETRPGDTKYQNHLFTVQRP